MRSIQIPISSQRTCQGMTLGEVLVVLVIVGILARLAIPSFLRSQGESRLDGDASKLAEDIQWTRLLATKSGKRSFLFLQGATRKWSIWLDKDSSLTFDSAKDSLIKRDSLGVSVQFGFGFTAPTVSAPLGTAVPSSGFGSVQSGNVDDCLPGSTYPASTLGTSTWASGSSDGLIVGCGGSIADLRNGVLYLTSTRSTSKGFAITFNSVTSGYESFSVRKYKWAGGTWSLQ